MPRFVYVDGPRKGVVDFRNLLPGEIPVDDGFYHLTNRIRDGIVEYRWQLAVTTRPPKPKARPKKRRATSPKSSVAARPATPGKSHHKI